MAEKLYEYEGPSGVVRRWRDNLRETWQNWKDKHPEGIKGIVNEFLFLKKENRRDSVIYEDYSHIYRRKTRKELVRISAAVMGIEFSYAAETAFVSPTLLRIGVEHKHMTLVWALSPLIGFFLTPILGSLSDRCPLKLGRRRPFILCMSLGVLLGLFLVPNGEDLGYFMGDPKPPNLTLARPPAQRIFTHSSNPGSTNESIPNIANATDKNYHPWGVFFTVLGTVLLDFDADACQSPARAYLLDVTVTDDHAKGLSTFTIMAGLGGFLGYALGGINWDATYLGVLLGGHVHAVFTLITIIFTICVLYTVTSFKEMPLEIIELRGDMDNTLTNVPEEDILPCENDKALSFDSGPSYGSFRQKTVDSESGRELSTDRKPSCMASLPRSSITPSPNASLGLYLKSVIYMPKSIRILCLTNLFSWMAHVCYSLYFTDFVGESIFGGNPKALEGTLSRQLYEEGIRFGCWGMSMYSLSCACYSLLIENFIVRFGARNVYVGGLLVYSSGMLLMALFKHRIGVIVFSWTAGVMYSTLFTMPYLLIAHYHAKGAFEVDAEGQPIAHYQIRGLGTDVAIVSSMVFLAQFILSMYMGSVVAAAGTTTAVVCVASALALFGAAAATRVLYLDL